MSIETPGMSSTRTTETEKLISESEKDLNHTGEIKTEKALNTNPECVKVIEEFFTLKNKQTQSLETSNKSPIQLDNSSAKALCPATVYNENSGKIKPTVSASSGRNIFDVPKTRVSQAKQQFESNNIFKTAQILSDLQEAPIEFSKMIQLSTKTIQISRRHSFDFNSPGNNPGNNKIHGNTNKQKANTQSLVNLATPLNYDLPFDNLPKSADSDESCHSVIIHQLNAATHEPPMKIKQRKRSKMKKAFHKGRKNNLMVIENHAEPLIGLVNEISSIIEHKCDDHCESTCELKCDQKCEQTYSTSHCSGRHSVDYCDKYCAYDVYNQKRAAAAPSNKPKLEKKQAFLSSYGFTIENVHKENQVNGNLCECIHQHECQNSIGDTRAHLSPTGLQDIYSNLNKNLASSTQKDIAHGNHTDGCHHMPHPRVIPVVEVCQGCRYHQHQRPEAPETEIKSTGSIPQEFRQHAFRKNLKEMSNIIRNKMNKMKVKTDHDHRHHNRATKADRDNIICQKNNDNCAKGEKTSNGEFCCGNTHHKIEQRSTPVYYKSTTFT